MTHSFLLAFCHLHIILHFFSRSPPLPASIVSSFLPQSFNPSFTLSPSLSVFFLSFFLFFHNFLLFTPRLHLFSCVFFLVSICSFCNIRRREEFHLRNTWATFVFSLEKKRKCNFNPWLFQFQFVSPHILHLQIFNSFQLFLLFLLIKLNKKMAFDI